MNMDEQDRLLDEIVTGVELGEFRAESLRTALGSMRRARRGRNIRTGLVASVPVVLTVLLLVMRNGGSLSDNVDAGPRANRSLDSGPVEMISDEDLFALFPGRPIALIGSPGEQEFLFLDGLESAVGEEPME